MLLEVPSYSLFQTYLTVKQVHDYIIDYPERHKDSDPLFRERTKDRFSRMTNLLSEIRLELDDNLTRIIYNEEPKENYTYTETLENIFNRKIEISEKDDIYKSMDMNESLESYVLELKVLDVELFIRSEDIRDYLNRGTFQWVKEEGE